MEARERIIERSIELFTKLGIRYVTMDQIAGELGMSKRTIYEIFRDKDDLLKHCIIEIAERNNNELKEIINNSNTIIEALFQIGQHGEKKRASLNPLFFEDIDRLYPEMRSLFLKNTKSGEDSVSYTILKQGIQEGIFNQEINLEVVNIFLHQMMRICHNQDLFPGNINTSVIMKNIVIPYFRGISTSKGRELIDKQFSNAISEQ
jgi:AcrR family transcriptional regulator